MLDMISGALDEARNDGLSDGLSDGLNKTEAQILRLLRQDPTITQRRIAGQLNKSKSTVERAIRKLKQSGKIKRAGSDKVGQWELLS